MELQAKHVWLCNCLVLILLGFVSHSSAQCSYTVTIQTGNRWLAGTNARVFLRLCSNPDRCPVAVDNIAFHGTNGPIYDYFEQGALDQFVIRTPLMNCFDPCQMTIGHDDRGPLSGWYLDFVNVEATQLGNTRYRREFEVYRWLATDEPPYTIEETKNQCTSFEADASAGLGSSLLRQYVTV